MADVGEVEGTLHALARWLERLDPGQRALMPSRRTLEAHCPDVGRVWHAFWRNGLLSEISDGPAPGRWDIRLTADSDDVMAMVRGDLEPGRAWMEDRLRVQAPMTDLLRLRAVL